MNKHNIALHYRNSLVFWLPSISSGDRGDRTKGDAFVGQCARLGFAPSNMLVRAVECCKIDDDVRDALKVLDNSTKSIFVEPMYPNFPEQVLESSDLELVINAIDHYWSCGELLPAYEKIARPALDEDEPVREIGLITPADFQQIYDMLCGMSDAWSNFDRRSIEYFVQQSDDRPLPITSKENLCFLAARRFEKGRSVSGYLRTATDVLRFATSLSGGDISLAENTRFRKFKRSERKMICEALESVIREEDIQRHRNKWIPLFHALHVGDYSQKIWKIARKFRNNKPVRTFNGSVEKAISEYDYKNLIPLLSTRPGDMARRLDDVLVKFPDRTVQTLTVFENEIGKIPTRVLLQLYGHFGDRGADKRERLVIPKGNLSRAMLIDGKPGLKYLADAVCRIIENQLVDRFSKLPPLGKVYIDPAMDGCPIPFATRSASDGKWTATRGTRIPMHGDKGTLRLFVYWVGKDIDLSATFHNEDFALDGHCSWTNLTDKHGYCHSGDVVSAPQGAAEYIDVDIENMLAMGRRYVVMNVLVFIGPTFAEHEECFMGWMERSEPGSGEIFNPKLVAQHLDLAQNAKHMVPVAFDLKTREAIWLDIAGKLEASCGTVEARGAEIMDILRGFCDLSNKVRLERLLSWHALARGERVDSPDGADLHIGWEGDIKPTDVSRINSEFMK